MDTEAAASIGLTPKQHFCFLGFPDRLTWLTRGSLNCGCFPITGFKLDNINHSKLSMI